MERYKVSAHLVGTYKAQGEKEAIIQFCEDWGLNLSEIENPEEFFSVQNVPMEKPEERAPTSRRRIYRR